MHFKGWLKYSNTGPLYIFGNAPFTWFPWKRTTQNTFMFLILVFHTLWKLLCSKFRPHKRVKRVFFQTCAGFGCHLESCWLICCFTLCNGGEDSLGKERTALLLDHHWPSPFRARGTDGGQNATHEVSAWSVRPPVDNFTPQNVKVSKNTQIKLSKPVNTF